jgi:hypothetical protein
MKCRRGISEIVSAMIIIVVVVSGLGIYSALSQQRVLEDTRSVKDTMALSEDQLKEAVERLGMFKKNKEVRVLLHNYGLKNVTISGVFVNGTKDMSASVDPVYVRSLTGANLSSILPVGKTTELILNFTQDSKPLQRVDIVTIRTTSDKLIEIKNGTN